MTNARLGPAERALPGYAPDANDGADRAREAYVLRIRQTRRCTAEGRDSNPRAAWRARAQLTRDRSRHDWRLIWVS